VEESNVTLVLQEERPEDSLAVDLRRSDIQAAVAGADGEPVALLLDIEARPVEGDEPPTQRRVALSWDTADLERLLNQSDGDQVRLMIDGRTLHDAWFDPDVEAHGMREKLVVFAAVAAMAAGGAASASAMPMTEGGQSSTAASQVARDMPSDTQQATVAGASERVTARDMPADTQLAAMQAAAASVARDLPGDSQAASLAGAGSSSVARDMPADSQAASIGGAQGSVARDKPADSQAAALAASQSGAGSTSAESSSLPSPETVIILGGTALTLLAAGFAASRQRPRPGVA